MKEKSNFTIPARCVIVGAGAVCALLYASYGYTQIRHGHIHVTIITEMLPGKGKYILWAITSWIGAAAGVIFAYATYAQAVQQVEKNTYTMMLYIPYAPVYIFGFIGALAFTLALLLHAVKAVIAIFNDDYAKEIAKNNFITVR